MFPVWAIIDDYFDIYPRLVLALAVARQLLPHVAYHYGVDGDKMQLFLVS